MNVSNGMNVSHEHIVQQRRPPPARLFGLCLKLICRASGDILHIGAASKRSAIGQVGNAGITQYKICCHINCRLNFREFIAPGGPRGNNKTIQTLPGALNPLHIRDSGQNVREYQRLFVNFTLN